MLPVYQQVHQATKAAFKAFDANPYTSVIDPQQIHLLRQVSLAPAPHTTGMWVAMTELLKYPSEWYLDAGEVDMEEAKASDVFKPAAAKEKPKGNELFKSSRAAAEKEKARALEAAKLAAAAATQKSLETLVRSIATAFGSERMEAAMMIQNAAAAQKATASQKITDGLESFQRVPLSEKILDALCKEENKPYLLDYARALIIFTTHTFKKKMSASQFNDAISNLTENMNGAVKKALQLIHLNESVDAEVSAPQSLESRFFSLPKNGSAPSAASASASSSSSASASSSNNTASHS